mmetsp:Transcript_86790/g.278410  ORF Transcript_86790/g.278410 Transcript_86790/m.278410 type:complete len:172 (+) Transcript_86790:174-689(+)
MRDSLLLISCTVGVVPEISMHTMFSKAFPSLCELMNSVSGVAKILVIEDKWTVKFNFVEQIGSKDQQETVQASTTSSCNNVFAEMQCGRGRLAAPHRAAAFVADVVPEIARSEDANNQPSLDLQWVNDEAMINTAAVVVFCFGGGGLKYEGAQGQHRGFLEPHGGDHQVDQ